MANLLRAWKAQTRHSSSLRPPPSAIHRLHATIARKPARYLTLFPHHVRARVLILETPDYPPFRREQQKNPTDQTNQHIQQTDNFRDKTHDRTGRAAGTYFRSIRPGAVDARDLATVPNPTPPPPGRPVSDRIPAGRAPLDARNLGTRQPSNGPRIIKTHVGSRDDRGPQIFSRRDPSDRNFQGGSTNASHTRNRGPPNGARKDRTSSGGAKKRTGGTRIGGGVGGNQGKTIFDQPDEEEIEYLKTRERASGFNKYMFGNNVTKYTRENDPKPYTPADMSIATLQGMGLELECGQLGEKGSTR